MAHYSAYGKIVCGCIGLFATAIFGIPIGLLGAGFEELVTNKHEDTPDELEIISEERVTDNQSSTELELFCYRIVNGIGSQAAIYFEMSIYFLIAASVTVGIIQTVDGYGNAFSLLEVFAVLVFTVEYIMRFIGAAVDPAFASSKDGDDSATWSRLKYMISFYSVIDLLAILPFYLAVLFPDSWFDRHGDYL